MKIVMVSSESNPICKTGGLADVVYSLSRELVKEGHEVLLFLPYYKSIKDKHINAHYAEYDYVDLSWRHQYVGVYDFEVDGIKIKLIDNEYYFNRDNLYGYDDDGERFAYFTMAVQKILAKDNINPDIIHIHDWQVGMLPALMKVHPICNNNPSFVLTIHNSAFKGYLPKFCLGDLYNLNDELFDSGAVRLDGQVSTLKAAIHFCEKITTVSPTYRNELLSSGSGQGLNEVLEFRKDDFAGILNGIDIVEFDPSNDRYLSNKYNLSNYETEKIKCKKELLNRFGIANYSGPTYGLVSRLTWQKGIDLIISDAKILLERGANIIFLGSGEKQFERTLQWLRDCYPNQIGIYIGYNDELAHMIYAGSDFLLMPSLFEPCGLSQMIAQRYGTLPIVRETGGLWDTVHAEIDGFSFSQYSAESLFYVLHRSVDVYWDKPFLNKLIKQAMSLDRSWHNAMKLYEGIYKEIVK